MKVQRKNLPNARHGPANNRLNPQRNNTLSVVGLLLLGILSFGALFSLHGFNANSVQVGDVAKILIQQQEDYESEGDGSNSQDDEEEEEEDAQHGDIPLSSPSNIRRANDNVPATLGGATTRRTKAITKSNVIVVAYNASSEGQDFTTVDCQIDEYHGVEESANAKGNERPVVLRGVWDPPNENWRTEAGFLDLYGEVPYYIKDNFVQVKNEQCFAKFDDLWHFIVSPAKNRLKRSLLSFTNDKENPALFGEDGNKLNYQIPEPVKHIDSFAIVSTMTKGQSHEFHRHGESWIGQAAGHKVWWFLPPNHKAPKKVNACDYLSGKATPPKGTTTCIQGPGDVIWFPHNWYHATCSLTEWNVALGRQLGPRINQNFKTLPLTMEQEDPGTIQQRLSKCSGEQDAPKAAASSTITANDEKDADWTWFDGDLNAYYNSLEKDHKRNPQNINDYAVHRWLGEKKSTQIHYEMIHESILKHLKKMTSSTGTSSLSVLDAGCGLGAALVWMETKEPSWKLEGRTLSEEQANFINNKLPSHNFEIQLDSYDNLTEGIMFDAIYSIEAAIHSTDMKKTLKAWSKHLNPTHGVVVLIDDFLQPSVDKTEKDVDLFARSWLANSLYTVTELNTLARKFGLALVESRDLLAEYRVVELNYRNQIPSLDPGKNRNHQGWMGSKYRQKLTVEGKLGYNLLVFRKLAPAKKLKLK